MNPYYIGVNDHETDLFEGQYSIPNGISYNSYLILDEKIAILDTVDCKFANQWLKNMKERLNGKSPDYLVISHMEPDHSGSLQAFLKEFPQTTVVGNSKTFVLIQEYFGKNVVEHSLTVTDGQELPLGAHSLQFFFAPMVHWPEVMVSYDSFDKTLYSADAFGKFGALDRNEAWDDEARRYYIGIVGKYGIQVGALLKKLSPLAIERICPLHGPTLTDGIAHSIELYKKWSGYVPEREGVLIAYTSVYGHTKAAAELLYTKLKERGTAAMIYDVARTDRSLCVAEAFRYSKLVIATTTYNADIFPAMREFIDELTERNFQSREVGIIENGSWSPVAAKKILSKFEKSKNLTYLPLVKISSALNEESLNQLEVLVDACSLG